MNTDFFEVFPHDLGVDTTTKDKSDGQVDVQIVTNTVSLSQNNHFVKINTTKEIFPRVSERL